MSTTTEKYPHGKISDDDEGAVGLIVDIWKGHVRIRFQGPCMWLAFLPEQAELLGKVLIARARKEMK